MTRQTQAAATPRPKLPALAGLVIAFMASAPLAAHAAGPEPGRISGSISVGADAFGAGDLHGGAAGRAPSLQALNPGLPAVPADLNIQSREYSDVYDAPLSFGAEVAYGFSENIEIFGAVTYSSADEGLVQVGSAFVPALNATLPVFGQFGENTALLLEGGARYYFAGDMFRPFVGGRIGIARLDGLSATFTIPDAPAGGIRLANVPFFDDTDALTIGAEAGVAVGFGENIEGQFSVGVRQIGEYDGNDSVISTLGLASINNGSERTTIPVRASLRIAF
jgi:hypothetical protein